MIYTVILPGKPGPVAFAVLYRKEAATRVAFSISRQIGPVLDMMINIVVIYL